MTIELDTIPVSELEPVDTTWQTAPKFSRAKKDWMQGLTWKPVSVKSGNVSWTMRGHFPGAETHPKRKCAVCAGRPILRFVRGKGFCGKHLSAAWAAQAAEPMPFEEVCNYV